MAILLDGPYLQHQGWEGKTMPEPVNGRPYHPGFDYIPRWGVAYTDLQGLGAESAASGNIIEELRQKGRQWVLTAIRQFNDLGVSYGYILNQITVALDESDPGVMSVMGHWLELKRDWIRTQMASVRETRDWLYAVDEAVFGGEKGQQADIITISVIVGKTVVALAAIYALYEAWEFWVADKNDTARELCIAAPQYCDKAFDIVGKDDILGVGKAVSSITTLVLVAAAAAGGFYLWKAVKKP